MMYTVLSTSWLTTLRPEELLVVVLGVLLGLLTSWCFITWLIAHINLRLAILIAPPLMRAALIAGLVAGAGTAAHAQESVIDTVNGLMLPDRPLSTNSELSSQAAQGSTTQMSRRSQAPTAHTRDVQQSAESQAPASNENEPDGRAYLVKAGDSLWAIAVQHLDPGSSNAEIATSVARWHESNRLVIGSNPNLIHPGQQLKEPPL